jgi:hypothetical protein
MTGASSETHAMKNTPVKTTSTTPDGDWVFAARIALAEQNLPHANVLRASSPTFETTASQNLPALELEFDSRFGGRSSLEFNLCADRCDADAGGPWDRGSMYFKWG